MAGKVRSVDFLPEIFQTPVNDQFLSATLDQLVQEPQFKKTQGYIGRKIGPGVNPADRYVIEPTEIRNQYQLEPGVVELDPDNSNKIINAITYPGIQDTVELQGGTINNASRLYTSEYYAWDPFIDLDKFINFSQYYWLPAGPDAVDVSSTTIPLTDNFVITRENGAYKISGYAAPNPTLTLARTGSYTFTVSQNAKENITYRVTNQGTAAYEINYQPNPTLTVVRGNTYTFDFSLSGPYPFWIKTQPSLGTINPYNNGVDNNGTATGTLTWVVPEDAPNTLYYSASNEFNMRGQINVIDAVPGTGPGFWIQTDPGVDGRVPATPNVSSRDVLGVIDNGIDLGDITFNVPLATAQDFYYSLTNIGSVDLATTLQFDQINNIFLEPFLAQYGGIDGITDLNGRTIVFMTQNTDPDDGGWLKTSQFDPIASGAGNAGQYGTFDTTPFDQTIPITDPTIQYGVWRITYQTSNDGTTYMTLNSVQPILNLQKFNILFGNSYAGTSWYKSGFPYFQRIPLLTADRDLLFYQDGLDPEIFGQIRIVDPVDGGFIKIENIIGAKNYTSPNGVVFTNGLKVVFRGNVDPISYQNEEYYVEGVGSSIKLLPVKSFITPEPYTQSFTVPYDSTPYDVGAYDETKNAPVYPDYLLINRGSPDQNPWTRTNRWFHQDVIRYSAERNNVIATFNNEQRAKRPIIEFRPGTRLFDFGTDGVPAVDIVDTTTTDALATVNGQIGFGTDGYTFREGTTVIFSADRDINVRNKIYTVTFIEPDTVAPIAPQPVIELVPLQTVLYDQNTVSISGIKTQGVSFVFDGEFWTRTQQKTKLNQAPLFNVYDSTGISFGDQSKYPSTTFAGSKLFSYAIGSGPVDPVLGLPLRYLTISNVGEIVFENNLYKDSFIYVPENTGITVNVGSGFVREYNNRIDYVREIGWQTGAVVSQQRQQFRFVYDGNPNLLLDVKVNSINESNPLPQLPPVQLYVDSAYILPQRYNVVTTANTTTITLLDSYTPGAVIEVAVLSDQISKQAFYQIPINLENNPLNGNSDQFTLGTVRNHYGTIAKNLLAFRGVINGPNNTRDLGNIIPYGQQILQQSSPLTLTGYFMRSDQYNIFASLEYNNREYIKFKNLLLESVANMDLGDLTVPEILNNAISEITKGRTNINPFYWSDMLPTGVPYANNSYTVSPITTNTFNTEQTYDFTSANYLGLLVYITPVGQTEPRLLERGTEYVVTVDAPKLTILVTLNVGDVVTIVEYNDTAGNFVPNTPTKLGLYPKYKPKIYFDPNYLFPRTAIRGHDGSVTIAFGDIRDNVLLEFEKRIYNNIKTDGNPIPLTLEDVEPGFFRSTDYSRADIQNIFNEEFLTWVGWNKVEYQDQTYSSDLPFTWNYSLAKDKIKNQPLPGAWRGIYEYFYDTERPNEAPWEMLGFTEEPAWWQDRYGPAPWTSDNLVLWDDLEAGYVADPVAPYIKPLYRRPGLTQVIPVGTEGQLLAPIDSVVGLYDATAFKRSWSPSDGGPTEAAWWTSSSYPFSVMRVLALTRPAQFFSLFADRDLYRYDSDLGQYLYNGRYRLDANGIEIYGNGTSKASYINWIVDYNRQLGINSTDSLTTALKNLDVRLCYRMASFTEQQNLKIYVERSSPNSLNSSLLLPPESYKLLLYKNQPFGEIVYSSVIIEIVEGGYSVYGYSNSDPYFNTWASLLGGATKTITAGSASVKVPSQYTKNLVQIPYGYVFTNTTGVVDFLLSYGEYLTSQGLIFDNVENGYTLNWTQMAQEFLYWANQGWVTGTIINLNPSATKLSASRPISVVDTIVSTGPENILLDQNRKTFPTRNLVVERIGNNFSVSSTTDQTISYLRLRYVNYENMIVFDNVSRFSDLVYDPITAARQNRMVLNAYTSTEWNGQLNAQGFILNENNVKQWIPNKKYTKGEIVLYKNQYWQAMGIVQPKLEFDYADWSVSDYDRIEEGLLPNIANKADQLSNTYNTYTANLNSDNDLLSYGLIGFRPRQYMQALNLDDTSQVNLYQQFLPTKGTVRAAEIFTGANLGKETGQYDIYENWAILNGVYGANANRRFIELQLNETYLKANPSTVQLIYPDQPSQADQTIFIENIWAASYPATTPEIFTTIYAGSQTGEQGLPSAGYVNLEDVDITVFSLDDPSAIAAYINNIGIGTTIWVAKTNPYDWNIYRCEEVPGRITQVSDNLNGTSLVQFTQAHGLETGDLIIIRFFNESVDGVYRVLSTPSTTSLTVAYSFNNTNQTSISGEGGLAFYLQTARVSQASDVYTLPYANRLVPGARVWVDNDGNGRWEVIEKQDPFVEGIQLDADSTVTNSGYGSSVAQASKFFAAMVGAPNINQGVVYTYRRDIETNYIPNTQMLLESTDVAGFGNAIDFGDTRWAVIGASASNSGTGYALTVYLIPGTNDYDQTQLLVAPGADATDLGAFGSAVAISQDERWMYIGSPDENKVYAYGRVDIEQQTKTYTGDGSTNIFNYDDYIQIDNLNPQQLVVVVGNFLPTLGLDYILSGGNVVFTTPPGDGQTVIFSRRQTTELPNDGSSLTYDLSPYLYTATEIDGLKVQVNGVFLRPYLDYTFAGTSITFSSLPAPSATIVVTSRTYWKYISTITVGGLPATARFGHSLSTSTDGRQILIGSPFDNVDSIDQGSVYAFDRGVASYAIDATNSLTDTFAIPGSAVEPIAVKLNGQYLTNTAQYFNGQFTVSGSDIVLSSSVTLTPGDILEIETNEIQLVEQLLSGSPQEYNEFGYATKLCHTNCSVYVGEPKNNSTLPQTGAVDRYVNQTRLYGIITSEIANPVLTPGAFIRVNNIQVEVPVAGTVASLVDAINNQGIPNVVARNTNDLTLIANGVDKIFDIGSIYSDAVSYTPVVYLNEVLQTEGVDYTYNASTEQLFFVSTPPFEGVITVISGRMVISVINSEAAMPGNMLNVLPGLGTSAFDELGFTVYPWVQEIVSPNPVEYAYFGSSLDIDTNSVNLVVGAPNGDIYEPVTFDGGETYFDQRSTIFSTLVPNGGVVYTFNFLPSATQSLSNPGKFIFGQQVFTQAVQFGDQFGFSVNYTDNRLLVGAPGNDLGDSTGNYGDVTVFGNPTNKPAWAIIRAEQPVVDVYSIDTVFSFDKLLNSTQTYYDFFDPLQGKILGAARRNIDYIGAVDPAFYNQGDIHNNGTSWTSEHVGEMWWDTNMVRFIDPNQDDVFYASRRWGQTFPGSRIDIYQWTASPVPPAQYTGPGVPLSTTSYTVNTGIDQAGLISTEYYFWVRGLTTVNTGAGKTLSPTAVARYIEFPNTSGIPYIAALNASTVAIYNALDLISAQDTILHIGFEKQITTANIHTEYQLIADGREDSFLSDQLYKKFQDSFCGANAAGGAVPDVTLPPGERYGVQFRPRQSMFVDRFKALQNYLGRANSVLKQFPVVETRRFNLLNSAEPEPSPSSGEYNARVLNLEELGFQNLNTVPVGYKYLVVTDSSQQGQWTIYTVTSTRELLLTRIQNYNTRLYWQYIDWYQPGYNSSIQPLTQVPTRSELDRLSFKDVPIGSSVKVAGNGQHKFEIYLRTELGWDRVGLQDGTIEFKEELWNYSLGRFGFDSDVFDAQYFDQQPTIETRKIIQAINEELFIDDLAIERNKSLILMFNFIYTELEAPEWLVKTSLVDVDHRIRSLLPYQIYLQDNQTFVLDYIQEVKPYHVQVREFNLIYSGSDVYPGALTDFDVPAYWDTLLQIPQFVSPILTPYTPANSVKESNISDAAPNAAIWSDWPYREWFNHYLLEIRDVVVVNGGFGYTVAPQIIVSGDCIRQAQMTAVINSAGQVVGVNIDDPGYGYLTTAILTLDGGNGDGARLTALMGNPLVRSIKTTIKYDRYQYTSDIQDWQANVNYAIGTQVRYLDRVWEAITANVGTTFDPDYWLEVQASTLSGIDRTQGFYAPTVNEPGRQLGLVIEGIDYPGVQVYGLPFTIAPGYDSSNYDVTPFDNITYSAEGTPTYDLGVLDTIYGSPYLDPFLGTRPTSINVDGGAYIDTYASHAPEELIPGAEFDTLDMRIYETSGLTWRIFQDMRGQQLTYRITPSTTTELVQPLSATADIIYVQDASALPTPYFGIPSAPANVWGVITINGERIMYRDKDTTNNTVSSLIRGTAGTAAAAHTVGSLVYDMSKNNLVPMAYQNFNEVYNELADGTNTTFVAEDISVADVDPADIPEVVEVYVGGSQQSQNFNGDGFETEFTLNETLTDSTCIVLINGLEQTPTTDFSISGTTLTFVTAPATGDVVQVRAYYLSSEDPLTVEFVTAPPAGVQVSIVVRRALDWYTPGTPDTALADIDNPFTEFLRGA